MYIQGLGINSITEATSIYFLTTLESIHDNITLTPSNYFWWISTLIIELSNLCTTPMHIIKFSFDEISWSFNFFLISLLRLLKPSTSKMDEIVKIFLRFFILYYWTISLLQLRNVLPRVLFNNITQEKNVTWNLHLLFL